ncbi:hypothetical protein [Faecalispora jeddahensis]|uniref:hypothetical protein n=1 Tax=Faecalispora jeddahensis TaxID=1414721 RepID=UPI002DD63938|nr:hypothetical protein [Faecalispora jeddahensis]
MEKNGQDFADYKSSTRISRYLISPAFITLLFLAFHGYLYFRPSGVTMDYGNLTWLDWMLYLFVILAIFIQQALVQRRSLDAELEPKPRAKVTRGSVIQTVASLILILALFFAFYALYYYWVDQRVYGMVIFTDTVLLSALIESLVPRDFIRDWVDGKRKSVDE